MSLIIEALKRARDDAIRRQAAAKGLPLAPVPRMRGRSRWLAFALLPLAAALVVCLLLLIDLYSRIPDLADPVDSTSTLTGLEDSAAASAAAISPDIQVPPHPAPVLETSIDGLDSAPPQSSPAPTVRTAPPEKVKPAADEMAPAATATSTTPPARPEPRAPSPEMAAAPGAREFIGQAQLLDGQLVDLGGIAWSESEPFALLNGQVLGVGESIRAYRVSEIRRDRVVLEQGDDRVVLRLK